MFGYIFCFSVLALRWRFYINFFVWTKKLQENHSLLKSEANNRFFARTKKLSKKCFTILYLLSMSVTLYYYLNKL